MGITCISLFTWLNIRFQNYSLIGIINIIIAFAIKGLQILFIIMIYKLLKAKLADIKSIKHNNNLYINPYESVYEDFD